jgi:hypothetical protein
MKLSQADRKKLLPLLEELSVAVEELLLTGLTTASEATRRALGVSFQEASRLGLLRLSTTLRVANEELGRFTRNEAEFSRKRLTFFLNRAWLLGRGLARALREDDESEFDRLVWVPASSPVERLDLVTLGVAKRVATGASCGFEFRLRLVNPAGNLPAGQRLTWSCVFPLKPGTDVPPEGFLHMPQKQKFTAAQFLESKTITIGSAAVALDGHGGGRISLGEQSTVTIGEPFEDWARFQVWEPSAAVQRVRGHEPGPLDLEVETQEEVVLDEWQMGEPAERDGQAVFPIAHRNTPFEAVAPAGVEGQALRKALEGLRKKKKGRPPLFALMHYEMCRLVLQPLAIFSNKGPEQLMLSGEKIDRAALLKTIKF